MFTTLPGVAVCFYSAVANDTIPQTGSHACSLCSEPPRPLMEELWREAKRLSKLASGPRLLSARLTPPPWHGVSGGWPWESQ